jgi:hypothetical protein
LHLVRFELISRQIVNFQGMQQAFSDEAIEEGIAVGPVAIVEGGTNLIPFNILMHDGKSLGLGYKAVSPNAGTVLSLFEKENVMYGDYTQPLDTITALPGQVTTIRATFDKPGRYVWHCHVLTHEDHQMMRVFHVGDVRDGQYVEKIQNDYDNSIPEGVKESDDNSSMWKLLVTLLLSILLTICSVWVMYRIIYDANGITVDSGMLRYDAVPAKDNSVLSGASDTSEEDFDDLVCQGAHKHDNDDSMEEGKIRIG